LSKYRLLFGKSFDLSTAVDGRKECLGVKLDKFLGCFNECHNWPLSRVPSAQKATSYDEGRINAQEGREQRQICGQKLRFRPTTIMISPLPSKVNNPPHLADFAALRDCSALEAAPAARLKALSSAHNRSENRRS
jgi:hypothetical protein